jgi:uncharacterized membrane protein
MEQERSGPKRKTVLRKIAHLDAHHRLFIALIVTIIAWAVFWTWLELSSLLIAAWDVFALASLGLSWAVIVAAEPRQVRSTARLQDSSRKIIFTLVVTAACASLVAVGFLVGRGRGLPRDLLAGRLALSVLAVVSAWLLVHTTFALRYAHLYFGEGAEGGHASHAGGLAFPGEGHPDYADFAYFSFVIGMTSQVSDVAVTSKQLRRLVLIHGILSFGFNTLILALTVNVVSGLL